MPSPALAAGGAAFTPTLVSSAQGEFLFTVKCARATTMPSKLDCLEDEKFHLTMSGVAPLTLFPDRPFRDAKLTSPKALVAN